ncbi:hypothetical protein [Streptomyces sp. NPDC048659]|uniref:hypothetical protein n=1 Tax=Streptomyces sp. NPDC048659 TaxID=3155489 RepID=UPI003414122A
MTQPDRHTADTITSDALDQLYADLEQAEAERDRYRSCWHSARDRAQALGEGTLRHVADRDAWKAWTKKAEEAVQYWYDAAVERLERAKQAEAATERVRAYAADLDRAGWTQAAIARRIRTALDEQQEQQ